MKRATTLILSLMILITNSVAQTYISPGDVSGTWALAGSPFYIQGEITVPDSNTLTIEPGVNVVFLGHYKLNVQGRLIAVGTQQDSIRFTADSIEIGWHGIRFMNTPITNDTSKMIYCSFKYGKANTGNGYDRSGGAILIVGFDKVIVSNCLFESNVQSGNGWTPIEAGPAIYFIYSSPIIINSIFTNNTGSKGGAISCLNSQSAIISNNVFSDNWGGLVGPIIIRQSGTPIITGNIIFDNYAGYMGGGIAVEMGSTPRIENNIIFNNEAPDAGGIVCWINVNAILINNTIVYNIATNSAGGLRCDYNSHPILLNNIIYGNSATSGSQVFLYDADSDPNFLYCDIQGGKEGFGGIGAGNNFTGLYENNIDEDPMFRDSTNNNFHLMSTDCGSSFNSPCIDTGDPDIPDTSLHCLWGLGTDRSDMGAYGGGDPPLSVEDPKTEIPTEFLLLQNYPNPFNPITKIKYSIPSVTLRWAQSDIRVTLKVFDILGNEIETLINEEKSAGTYEVTWYASNLPSGVYFYHLKTGSFIETKKMILMK